MPVRKMTFSLPEEIADRLTKQVPARDRSRYLARVLEQNLRESDKALVRACLQANRVADARAIEREFDQLSDPVVDRVQEPWDDAPPR